MKSPGYFCIHTHIEWLRFFSTNFLLPLCSGVRKRWHVSLVIRTHNSRVAQWLLKDALPTELPCRSNLLANIILGYLTLSEINLYNSSFVSFFDLFERKAKVSPFLPFPKTGWKCFFGKTFGRSIKEIRSVRQANLLDRPGYWQIGFSYQPAPAWVNIGFSLRRKSWRRSIKYASGL